MKKSNPSDEEIKKWHEKTIDTLGVTMNLFMGISFATIVFVLNLLLDKDFHFVNKSQPFFAFGIAVNLICSIRLIGHQMKWWRYIAENWLSMHDPKSIEKVIRSFGWSLFMFVSGEISIVTAFILQVADKFTMFHLNSVNS